MNRQENSHVFASAAWYRELTGRPASIRDARTDDTTFAFTERHLQGLWYDNRYRPEALTTVHGERVTVVNPGRWNLESGPDFLDAVLLIAPDQRRVCGDIEVHVRPGDWNHHEHAADPAYTNVVAHVTWFTGPRPALPEGTVEMALRDTVLANPRFSFDSLDLLSYPHAALGARITPCAAILADWTLEERTAMLDAAGLERLRIKTERLRAAIQDEGPAQALYEAIMVALGYKRNRTPFRALARTVPLETLQTTSQGDPEAAYALLMGVGGLLPEASSSRWDPETRKVIRVLWNHWWRQEPTWRDRCLPSMSWVLGGVRPQNHPARRLAAAAGLFAARDIASELVNAPRESPREWIEALIRVLHAVDAPSYWREYLTWGSPTPDASIALLGARRLAAIMINVVVPYLAARDIPVAPLLPLCPPEQQHTSARETANRLFGRDHSSQLYRTGLRQQGLLQIFHDFCLDQATDCANCTLTRALRQATPPV